jgi:hypothetical protein
MEKAEEKRLFFLIITFLIFIPAPNIYAASDKLFWEGLEKSEKLLLVDGYFEGYINGYFSYCSLMKKRYKGAYEEFCKGRERISGKDIYKAIDIIDDIYSKGKYKFCELGILLAETIEMITSGSNTDGIESLIDIKMKLHDGYCQDKTLSPEERNTRERIRAYARDLMQ